MRKDLAKCTTERERRGSGDPSRKWGGKVRLDANFDNEFGGFHPWGRRRNEDYGKSFSDVLSPLVGNLRKNVGRPWNDVYSEFCQFLDRRSLSGHHIFTHLGWEVATKTFVGRDGYIYSNDRRGGIEAITEGFYVDPVTGILCDAGRIPRHHYRKTPTYKELEAHNYNPFFNDDSGGYWERQDGIWYHFHTETWTVQSSYEYLDRDESGEVVIRRSKPSLHTKSKSYKRQIGGAELRDIRARWNGLVKDGLAWKKPNKNYDWKKTMFRGRI